MNDRDSQKASSFSARISLPDRAGEWLKSTSSTKTGKALLVPVAIVILSLIPQRGGSQHEEILSPTVWVVISRTAADSAE
jgi:hypothetical protein